MENNSEVAYLGGGCFWCLEAVYLRIKGVLKVQSGYMGGELANPTYQDVSQGRGGHVEIIKIWFDATKVSYDFVLKVFFLSHDPTTKNRQGNDVGPQYRSAIFGVDDEQIKIARQSIKEHDALFPNPIVTEIKRAPEFFVAEGYHQNYYNNNMSQPYCQLVIQSKLKKLKLI
ncbi:MAG: peptide-methionine (S)-S-oxide reductase MsrA [SAR324 cluster bacterium]|nr:peptide-methionine (S)-S-oxide reductase MsrA [SAR324 cluster bacterium]